MTGWLQRAHDMKETAKLAAGCLFYSGLAAGAGLTIVLGMYVAFKLWTLLWRL